MLYSYLITVYKVIVGLVTPERLIAVALGALGFYIIWIFFSLVGSFQRKFNSRCQDLVNTVLKTKDIEKQPELLDKKTEKISSGFGFAWKKFRSSQAGKPSDYIKRREALDVEINGGLLNNGKTMMRAYIAFFTTLLFIFNFAYVGGENPITFMTFAEAMILPFVFYVLIKLFYFLHSSIRQKLYRMDIESFYEAIDLLDSKFARKVKVTELEEEIEDEENQEEKTEESEENQEEQEPENQEETGLDKYDVFKKKNIDVSKIMNETPKSDSSLPYINVDSDYVIKDDDQVGAKSVGQEDNASTLFGGMMQNTTGLKKTSFVDVEKNIAEIDEEKLEQLNKKEEPVEENIEETEKVEDIEQTEESNETPIDENVTLGSLIGSTEESEDETNLEASGSSSKFIEIEKNEQSDEMSQEDSLSSVVNGFKANRSKLASGGMVIERNEPIVKRERSGYMVENKDNETMDMQSEPVETGFGGDEQNTITRPDASESTDSVLNTLKTMPGGYESYPTNQNFAPSTNYGNVGYDQGYGYANPVQPMYGNQINPQMQGYGYAPEPVYPNYNSNYGGYSEPVQQTPYSDFEDEEIEDEVEEQPVKKKVVRTKENEPRPRNLKSKTKKQEKEEETNMAKRGRPKKQEVSESMVIENDKQFNEVLSRAEKLMRKSEEGLSESQSKRIEKEIKILMDAMNRYKESK